MIELKSVSGSFGAGKVSDVSLRLPNGKTYGVFSHTYADAVALLALLGGAHTPTCGNILVGGFDMHREAKQARRGIAYLDADLLPDDALTPIEYLMTIADMRELPYDKTLRQVHEMLDIADLASKKETLIANLSRGEKRILTLLQLLLGNPESLVLASPISGLLPKDTQKARDLIKHFAKTHTVFLCTPSTHDLYEICDEIIVLQNGRFKAVLSAEDEALEKEFAVAAPIEESAPSAPTSKRRDASRWKMLLQSSGEYEVLDADQKEDMH